MDLKKEILTVKEKIKKYPRVCYCDDLLDLLEKATNDSTAINLLKEAKNQLEEAPVGFSFMNNVEDTINKIDNYLAVRGL